MVKKHGVAPEGETQEHGEEANKLASLVYQQGPRRTLKKSISRHITAKEHNTQTEINMFKNHCYKTSSSAFSSALSLPSHW